MKNQIITLILMFVLALGLKAQTIAIPTFSNESVIMYVYVSDIYPKIKPYVFITDGSTNFTADINPPTSKEEQAKGYYPQLADMLNQLKKQGYKLEATIHKEYTFKEFYFQKD